MKKFRLILVSTCVASSIFFAGVHCFADNSLNFMRELNVLNGDQYGNLNLENLVTRAEFTKMAVNASTNRNMVSSNVLVSPFADVLYTEWFTPYVYVGVKSGMVQGYSDGTFKPNQNVTLEEGCSILLSLLGYTSEDFGTSYPYGQTSMANNLGILKNVYKNIGDPLTRSDVASMIYNMLNTAPKSKSDKYMKDLSYSVLEDQVLVATPDTSENVEQGKVLLSNGTYKCSVQLSDVYLKGDFIVKNNDEIVDFVPKNEKYSNFEIQQIMSDKIVAKNISSGTIVDIDVNTTIYNDTEKTTIKDLISNLSEGVLIDTYKTANNPIEYCSISDKKIGGTKEIQSVDNYVIYQVLDDKVLIATTDNLSLLDISNDTVVYDDKTKTTVKGIKNSLVTGDIIRAFKDKNDKILYLSLSNNSLDGPYTVSSANQYSGYNIIKDGVKSNTLNVNDIVYVSQELNTVYAYSTKKTGIYESAIPNKDNPTSVVISGKTYSIESLAAFEKLSSRGDTEFGDWVTVCLGKSGKIADVVTNSTSETLVGFVLDTGVKAFTDSEGNEYSKSYALIVDETGEEREFATKASYTSLKNKLVGITFENSDAVLSVKQSQTQLSGTVDAKEKTLGKEKLSSDVKIIDIVGFGESTYSGIYKTLFLSRIDGVSLSSSQIYYYEKNSDGQICKLFLNNLSGDMFDYGIITSSDIPKNSDSTKSTYTYDVNGVSKTVTMSAIYSVGIGSPAQIKKSGENIFGLVKLKSFSAKLSTLLEQTISDGATTHYLSDNLVVYTKTSGGKYYTITMNELKNGDYSKVTVYYDKLYSQGGRVRIIIAE